MDGFGNSAFGDAALVDNASGNLNTAIGDAAGYLIDGSGNVCIGANVLGVAGEDNTFRTRDIGSTPQLTGINVTIDAISAPPGLVKLGHDASSLRYKEDIKPMEKASETLFALKPVTFRAKGNTDPSHVKQYGLIAEDVATVDPDLVVYNSEGKPEALRRDSINAMLLNEFLKEHRTVQQQQVRITELNFRVAKQDATIAQQQKGIEVLATQLKEQAAQIQSVSAQMEVVRPAAKVAVNKP